MYLPRLVLLPLALTAILPTSTEAANSRITEVKVFPGMAEVTRVAHLAAGKDEIVFACLPAALDAQSIQISSDVPMEVGEITLRTEPRALYPQCLAGAADDRIRELEDQQAALLAELNALGLVADMLKNTQANSGAISATATQIQRTGQDVMLRQHDIKRKQEAVEQALRPLLAERERQQGGAGAMVTLVRAAVAASSRAEVTLRYRVVGPGWTPAYRASLDSRSGQVQIERRALVAQATGEDWKGVRLVLSTSQPRHVTQGRMPSPWQFSVYEPEPLTYASQAPAPAAPPAPTMERSAAPLFDVSVFQGDFDTEFHPSRVLDIPSNGQRVAMVLDTQTLQSRMLVRTSPVDEATAYLLAYVKPPDGNWPRGQLQLYRDGTFVGNSQWQHGSHGEELALSFGPDENIRVRRNPDNDRRGVAGLGGGRIERRIERSFSVENRHRMPMMVEVLAAAPHSVNDQIRVENHYSPQPAQQNWQKQSGVVQWQQTLVAGERAEFSINSTVSWPKDLLVRDF